MGPQRGKAADSIYAAVEVVGDAWSWLVLRESLLHGTARFNEFQRQLGIARATLSSRLDGLVRGEMLRRTSARSRWNVEYAATPRGKDFFACLAVALRWGDDWCKHGRAPRLAATHVSCGKKFRAVLVCRACHAPIDARAVEVVSVARASSGLIAGRRQRTPGLDLLERVEPCSLARALMVLGDRWSSLVVRECFLGTRRFDDFTARLGVASNILTTRLRHLVEHGVLERRPYQERPRREEYRLTPKGMALYPVPLAMLAWGDRWLATQEPGIRLRHRPCGCALAPVLRCAACTRPATVDDVAFSRGVSRRR